MVHERTPQQSICHAINLYYQGVFCPAALWEQVVKILTPRTVAEVLGSLPAETQRQPRAVFDDRPSLPVNVELADTVAELVAWFDRIKADHPE